MTKFSEQRLTTHIRAGMSGGPSYVTLIAQSPGGVRLDLFSPRSGVGA